MSLGSQILPDKEEDSGQGYLDQVLFNYEVLLNGFVKGNMYYYCLKIKMIA